MWGPQPPGLVLSDALLELSCGAWLLPCLTGESTLDFWRHEGPRGEGGLLRLLGLIKVNLPVGSSEGVMAVAGGRWAPRVHLLYPVNCGDKRLTEGCAAVSALLLVLFIPCSPQGEVLNSDHIFN